MKFSKDNLILLSTVGVALILGLATQFFYGGVDVLSILRVLIWFSLAHIPFLLIATKTKYRKNVFVPAFILILFVIAILIIYFITSHTSDSWADLIYAIFIAFGSVFAVLSFFINLLIYRRLKNHDTLSSNPLLVADSLALFLSILMLFSYLDILGDMSIRLAPAYYLFVGGFGILLAILLYYIMKNKWHYYKLGLSTIPMFYVLMFHLEGIQDVSTILVSSVTTIIFVLLSQLRK
ncbi:MAG: hypothetical protein AB7U79_04040 [Candidatus Izemoplasmatales bacterium]